MRILLVEDNHEKLMDVKSVLELHAKGSSIEVVHSSSVARDRLRSTPPFDVAVLDMTLPRFADGEAQIDLPTREGEELLEEIDVWRLPTLAIIVSGYESFRGGGDNEDLVTIGQLETVLQSHYPGMFLGWVRYNASEDGWRMDLDAYLTEAQAILRARSSKPSDKR